MICMIGGVQEVKGHFILIEAAKKIIQTRPETRFLIVAGGVDEEYRNSWKGKIKNFLGMPFDNLERMKRSISEAKLNECFIFTGYRQDIPELLSASDIITFLSQKAEGFGRPIIEGMAMKKPVIATDIGPTQEILGEESGILVPVGDINRTADAVIRLIDNPILCESIGKKGRRRVEKKFDLRQRILEIQSCIDQTIN